MKKCKNCKKPLRYDSVWKVWISAYGASGATCFNVLTTEKNRSHVPED